MRYEVGQKLWCVEKRGHGGRVEYEVEISKIGKKYVEIKGWKTNKKLRMQDLAILHLPYTDSSSGKCYLSKEEYARDLEMSITWEYFRVAMPYSCPVGMTPEKVFDAMRVLFGEEAVDKMTVWVKTKLSEKKRHE